jgi:hypothetical protein
VQLVVVQPVFLLENEPGHIDHCYHCGTLVVQGAHWIAYIGTWMRHNGMQCRDDRLAKLVEETRQIISQASITRKMAVDTKFMLNGYDVHV